MELSNNFRLLSCACMANHGKQNSKRGWFRVKVNNRGVECECRTCGNKIFIKLSSEVEVIGKTEKRDTPIQIIEKELIRMVQDKLMKKNSKEKKSKPK